MIKIGFYGAAGEVTGSCYIVTTDRARVMVDMGMHQGEKEADEHNRRLPPHDLASLNAVVLTHAHLDHCGRLPLLVKAGYSGPIHCTPATAGITEIILRDSAHIQEEDAARRQRHAERRGGKKNNHKNRNNHGNHRNNQNDREKDAPLYILADVEKALPLLTTMPYDEVETIADGIRIKFVDSGHILGAGSVQMTIDDGGSTKTIVFSGDIGQVGAPILRDPITPLPADAVLLESTYGDRDHRSLEATLAELLSILLNVHKNKGKVLIPAFAVGRSQDIIYHIGEFIRTKKLPPMKVVLDSPMASAVSHLYTQHTDVYDDRALEILSQQMKPLSFPGLSFTQSVEESKALNEAKGPMVIISANGMCTGGRILHHLRHNLPDPNAHVVIVGYQGQGSLGRRLVNGVNYVSIFGNDVKVKARIHTLGGFSAHAGQGGLITWAAAFQESQPRMFLVHGEDEPRRILRERLKKRLDLEAAMPNYAHEVEL
jgi:metallo-beta-lactamase family protein